MVSAGIRGTKAFLAYGSSGSLCSMASLLVLDWTGGRHPWTGVRTSCVKGQASHLYGLVVRCGRPVEATELGTGNRYPTTGRALNPVLTWSFKAEDRQVTDPPRLGCNGSRGVRGSESESVWQDDTCRNWKQVSLPFRRHFLAISRDLAIGGSYRSS